MVFSSLIILIFFICESCYSLLINRFTFSSNNRIDSQNLKSKFYMNNEYNYDLECEPNEQLWEEFKADEKLNLYYRDRPDVTKMKPDDPRFLDMPWPRESGPEATAYARHLQWKRSLSDGERVRWQKWAVYKRIALKEGFDFTVNDYVYQRLLNKYEINARKALENNNLAEVALWQTLGLTQRRQEEILIRATVKAFYSAINRQNFDDVRLLWLPDDGAEATLPGYAREQGQEEIARLYRRIAKEAKPFCTINAEVVSMTMMGFIAVVHTIESIEAGYAFKVVKRKGQTLVSDTLKKSAQKSKKVLSTMILRKFHDQWRIQYQHSVRISSSLFTENQLDFAAERKKKTKLKESISKKTESKTNILPYLTSSVKEAVDSGSLPAVMSALQKINSKQEWDKIIIGGKDGIGLNKDENDVAIAAGGGGGGTSNQVEEIEEEKLLINKKVGGTGGGSAAIVSSKLSRDEMMLSDIDDPYSISKRTVQAVRALWKVGSITSEQKEILLGDIIRKVSDDQTSLVESAFELLVLKGGLDRPTRLKDRRAMDEEGLEEFADQCILLVKKIQTERENDPEENYEDY